MSNTPEMEQELASLDLTWLSAKIRNYQHVYVVEKVMAYVYRYADLYAQAEKEKALAEVLGENG